MANVSSSASFALIEKEKRENRKTAGCFHSNVLPDV